MLAVGYNCTYDILPFIFLSSCCPQIAPGAALLMRILEDFIHLIGEAQKPFQSFLVVTNNLSKAHSLLSDHTALQEQMKHSLYTNIWMTYSTAQKS